MSEKKGKEEKPEKKSLLLEIDESQLTDLEYERSLDEFFGDQDSIEYRVERIRPKGEGIEGFLDVHTAPFTFQDLKTLYGGGTYRIVKQKAGGGKGALLGAKNVTIAGQPKMPSQDIQDKGSPHEDLRAEIRQLKEEITRPRGNSVFTPDFVQELVTAKLLLDKGNSTGSNAELVKLLVQSGDKKFEGLLEGIELGKRLEGGGSTEEGEGSWLKPIAEMVARILQGKNLELNTVKRTDTGTDAAQVKVTPQPQIQEAPEQVMFQNLIAEVEELILEGIEKKTPAAQLARKVKQTAGSFILSFLSGLNADQVLAFLDQRYVADEEVAPHLKNPETRVYLAQVLEELKK